MATNPVSDNEKIENKPQQSVVDDLAGFTQRTRNFFKLSYYKLSNIERSNMELGIKQLKQGNYFDAYWRFRFVTFLNKNNAIAYYLMGKSQFYRQKYKDSVAPLNQALRLKPDLDEARFLLAAGGNPADIKSIPRSFIVEKLDYIATHYDQFISGTASILNIAIDEELKKIIGDNMGFNVLDLGCRGGDTSQMLRTKANAISGVEPSIKLSGIARTRRNNDLLTFNSLATRFPEDYLREVKEKFAVVFSTYYLDNLGTLEEFFALTTSVIEKGGLFVFNINKHDGAEDYKFRPASLLFAHSTAYVEKQIAANGLAVVTKREVRYPNNSVDILYITEKQ